MLRCTAILALILPLIANADVTVIEEAEDDGFINIAECSAPESDGLAFSWTMLTSGGSSSDSRLIVSDDDISTESGDCNPDADTYWSYEDDDLAEDLSAERHPTTGYADYLQAILSTLALTCDDPMEKTLHVCMENATGYATGSITFDTRPAPMPTIYEITAAEGSLVVEVTEGTVVSSSTQADSKTFEAVATGPDGVANYSSRETSTSPRIEGLENDVEYTVVAYAYTEAGNPSPPSEASTGAPIPVTDFWEGYRGAGGRDDGGCSGGSAGLLALLVPLVFVVRRRRS